MSVVAECLSRISLGEPQVHNNLTLFPLIAAESEAPRYQLLDEALASDCARVTEVSEAGSVPELKFVNECDRPVLLLDGEELVGAKQNRILNLTVLAPAHRTIVIPVSCVEAGRWRADSEEFASAERTYFSRGRARKAAHVTESLRTTGNRFSDQSEVWSDISEKAARMEAHSYTGAAAALYETHQASLEDYLGGFTATDRQVGALFAINDELVGLDLFDAPSTLERLLPKLVRSYALDAIDTGKNDSRPEKTSADKLMEDAAKAVTERFPAVGDGEDLRLQGEHLSGGALVADNKVVHLCVFRMQEEANAQPGNGGSRLVRASMRRRRMFWE